MAEAVARLTFFPGLVVYCLQQMSERQRKRSHVCRCSGRWLVYGNRPLPLTRAVYFRVWDVIDTMSAANAIINDSDDELVRLPFSCTKTKGARR